MKTNSRIPYMDVIAITKDMCEYMTGDEYEVIYVPVNLKDKNKLKRYLSVVACKNDETDLAKEDILKNEGVSKDEFKLNEKYCNITTYEVTDLREKQISFDDNDDYPIKACFNEQYEYVENFFEKFIKLRGNMINQKQIVKSDDIYQYFSSVTSFNKPEKESIFNRIMKKHTRK